MAPPQTSIAMSRTASPPIDPYAIPAPLMPASSVHPNGGGSGPLSHSFAAVNPVHGGPTTTDKSWSYEPERAHYSKAAGGDALASSSAASSSAPLQPLSPTSYHGLSSGSNGSYINHYNHSTNHLATLNARDAYHDREASLGRGAHPSPPTFMQTSNGRPPFERLA